MTIPFDRLPFRALLARIQEAASVDESAALGLLRSAGGMPDSEPLTRLVGVLAEAGRMNEALTHELWAQSATLSGPALQYLLHDAGTGEQTQEVLRGLVMNALRTWPIARISAIALLTRWLRRRFPGDYAEFLESSSTRIEKGSYDARSLLFASGATLQRLAQDTAWRPLVTEALSEAIDALANAPKSISQANAESLLARRVYADPGHFFFELLQNADDAEASSWRASVCSESVSIKHDGKLFSFHDVVGLLSIGQTTKRKDQIGFFGVGFKSVYEICERPRVRSGIFDFEIAHVSIPRSLSEGPVTGPPSLSGETVLDLPYASGVDVSALFRKALAIPPETLLTLPNVRALAVSSDTDSSWSWEEEWHEDVATLRRITGETRRYLCAREDFTFVGEREAGRSHACTLLVAVAIEEDGAPRPMQGSTLYAFLPTAQHTGLRCMVHARFDVTLDRERLERDSSWNDELLRAAGRAFADLVIKLVRAGHAVLPVLSAPSERAPMAAPFAKALRESLKRHPCLVGADGELVAPAAARLVRAELCVPLAGVDLGDRHRALGPLSAREEEIALSLGASPFTNVDLVHFSKRTLIAGEPPPGWYKRAPESAEPNSAVHVSIGEAKVSDEILVSIPLLMDGAGLLRSSEDAMEARSEWAALYAGIRPLVDELFLRSLPASLRARLSVTRFEPTTLLEDLRDEALGAALLTREDALLRAMSTLEMAQLHAFAGYAILRTSDGSRRALSDGVFRLHPSLASVREIIAKRVPLVAAELAERFDGLVTSWVPVFGLAELAKLLPRVGSKSAGEVEWDDASLGAVVELLGGASGSMSRDLAGELLGAAIFRDVHGARRPLVGPGRALIPTDKALLHLLPGWPWVSSPAGAFVQGAGAREVRASDVAAAFAANADEWPVADDEWAPALAWLSEHADRLSSRDAVGLLSSRVWLDEEEKRRGVAALRLPGGSDVVDALFRSMDRRFVAHPASVALAVALGSATQIAPSDAATAIGDLLTHGPPASTPPDTLAALLNEATSTLAAKELKRALELPIFRDAQGTQRPLASWSASRPDACHRPGALRSLLHAGSVPLLSGEDELLFAKFLYAVGPAPASSADLVRCLQDDEALLSEPEAVRIALQDHGDALDAEARDVLRSFPIFENAAGETLAASALCSSEELSAFLNEEEMQQLGLEKFLVGASQEALVRQLGLSLRPIGELVTEKMLCSLVGEQLLAQQPEPWRTRSALARLYGLAVHAGIDASVWPLSLDNDTVLTKERVASASAATRALLSALSIDARFADDAWSMLLMEEGRDERLEEIPIRSVTGVLHSECPDELPVEGHPLLHDPSLVFDWLMENYEAIEEDEDALAALSSSAIIPSQKRTFRCPKDLVLDASVPELGLSWGISRDVPSALASWLARTFELDRRQRRNVIDHVLSGLDAAAEADDAARASELIAFLASALGAGDLSPEALAERATHTKVRARLRVPLREGEWDKPRRARLVDADGDLVDEFCVDPPGRIALTQLDAPSRALLVACGATAGLSDKTVRSCLAGDGLKPGAAPRRALARYVARLATSLPRLRHTWGLDEVAWVPNRAGELARASALLWPDELAQTLLGHSAERFPADEVVVGLPENAAPTLGFKRAADLTLSEASELVHLEAASPELLDWLEDGLSSKRFSAADVRATFANKLRMRDDAGELRVASELALDGARALFGPWRGDFSGGARLPLLSRALSIPARPNAAMVLSFLEEISRPTEPEDHGLYEILPRCLEALAEANDAAGLRLPQGCLVAGRRDGALVLGRISDGDVRTFAPRALAEALPESALAELTELLPSAEGDEVLGELLSRSGARDLWCDFQVQELVAGPSQPLKNEAEHLWGDLARALGGRVGQSVRVVDPLSVRGALKLGETWVEVDVSLQVDALVRDDVLWLTPAAIEAPELLAPALERDPARRSAMSAWLDAREWASLPKRLRQQSAESKPRATSVFDRIRGFFRGDAPPEAKPKPKVQQATTEPRNDEGLFRPETKVRAQMGSSEGWLERRRTQPDFGFALSPPRLPAPWLYAPKTIATHFHRRRQSWDIATLVPPPPSAMSGLVVFRGQLPRGSVVLPVPMFGTVDDVTVDGVSVTPERGSFGQHLLRLDVPAKVVMRVGLGRVPDVSRALAPPVEGALASVVPDDELPEEVHDFLHDLDGDAPPFERALQIRDFIRERYRYDPSYLEDAGLGRWLARVTRGRANAHIAALHVGGDERHLGAGVCYELNALACELLRRAAIPAAIATGWVLEGGSVSDPDHLWCVALLQDAHGAPLWLPVDAASTQSGRPLRIARRPAGRFRAPKDPRAKAPQAPDWEVEKGDSARSGAESRRSTTRAQSRAGRRKRAAKTPKKRPPRVPRTELLRVMRHLERLAGQALSEEERAQVREALEDPKAASRLLARIRALD
ncbi:MAG: sacsin N-terminal ATP-binding-like domain-containing protein [Polyangiales bacterium]